MTAEHLMVSVSGLISGMDTKAIVSAFVKAKQRPITRMLKTKSGIGIQLSKIGSISSKMSDLKTIASGLQSVGEVLAYSGTSSNESALKVSATGAASPGSYAVVVNQLADFEKDRSAAFSGGAFDTVKAGTLTLTLDTGETAKVLVEEGETLTDVKNKINAAGLPLDASIINDGKNAYLQLVSRQAGHAVGGNASDAITISESYTGANGTELNLTEISTATNASFTLDGITVEKRSNIVADVLEGVSFDLLATGNSTVTVAQNKEGTKENVQAFVDAMNEVLSLVVAELRVTADTDPMTSLGGDFTIRKLQTDLLSLVTASVPGLSSSFDALTRIGIETGSDGLLKIDSTTFDKILGSDIMTIGEIFATEASGVADKTVALVDAYTDSSKGFLKAREDALNERIEDIDDQVIKMQDRVAQLQQRLIAQFTAMEQAMCRIKTQGGALTAFLGQQDKAKSS